MSSDGSSDGFLDLDGTTWDAVVIGAGPSGALAARQLSLAGAQVLLVEKRRFPRSKVCGACLSGAALVELRSAGLGSLVERLGAIELNEFQLRFEGRLLRLRMAGGAALSRAQLDAGLAASGVDAGCRFLEDTVALVEAEGEGERHVRLTRQGGRVLVAARVVLVAAGLGQCFVPKRGMSRTKVARRSWIGAGCRLVEAPPAYVERVVFMAVGAGGYVGMVRVEDGSVNVAAALDPDLVRRVGTPGSAALEVLREAGAPAVVGLADAQWQGTPGLTRKTRPLAQHRLFFLGDAAGYVEPFTGEGIAWALASGRAIEPLALRAIECWDPRLAREWGRAHRRLVGRQQFVCRALAIGLRQPWLVRLGFEITDRAPTAASAVLRHLNTPSILWNAS